MAGGIEFIDQDLKAFRDLALWLWNSHEKPWEWNGKPRAIYEEISRGYYSIESPEELELYLPKEEEVRSEFPPRKYLYLNPVEGLALVPTLTIASDFGRSIPELRIRLRVFFSHEGKTRWFGYRFESPEGPGIHHYYHAQPIIDLKGGESFLTTEEWLPTKCPTFPLDANNPVKLLLSLLISLYGISWIPQTRQHMPGIDRYLNEMHFRKLPGWELYKKVITHKGKVDFYATAEPEKFDAEMRAKNQKCEIRGVTKGMYQKSTAGQSAKGLRSR